MNYVLLFSLLMKLPSLIVGFEMAVQGPGNGLQKAELVIAALAPLIPAGSSIEPYVAQIRPVIDTLVELYNDTMPLFKKSTTPVVAATA